MPIYTTEIVKSLGNGESFDFIISNDDYRKFYERKEKAKERQNLFMTLKDFIEMYEFSLFSSFQKVVKIFSGKEFDVSLLIQILTEFGINENFIEKLIADPLYMENIESWFEGICCDGERAARTLKMVYRHTEKYFNPDAETSVPFWD
jgi:hypothetical protein